MNYLSKLKNKKWIEKRSVILKRDNYICTVCGSNKCLQVHYTYYINGRDPWQYPNKSLLTLCEKCHTDYHMFNEVNIIEEKKKVKKNRIKKEKKKKIIPLIKIQIIEPVYRKRNERRN